jgi:hypothetical protein
MSEIDVSGGGSGLQKGPACERQVEGAAPAEKPAGAAQEPSAGVVDWADEGGARGPVMDPPHPPGEPVEFTFRKDFTQPQVSDDARVNADPGGEDDEDLLFEDEAGEVSVPANAGSRLGLSGRGRRGRRLVNKEGSATRTITGQQRLLLLDTWQRSGLPAGDFAALVGISKHTLYAWKKKFDTQGPAGLMDQPKGGPRGSRLPDLTKRTILMLKRVNPEWAAWRRCALASRGCRAPSWTIFCAAIAACGVCVISRRP